METLYDWWAIIIFGALSITWLDRSVNQPSFPDPVLPYVLCAVACAGGNWLGNSGHAPWGMVVLSGAVVGYLGVIRPLRRS